MVSEGFVYVKTKQYLVEQGWQAIAGDPPRGTDLPPLEVKEPNTTHSLRKNANSVIFDLVFGKQNSLLLIECKDNRSKIWKDVKKLQKVIGNQNWRESLLNSLNSGSFLNRYHIDPGRVLSGDGLVPCVAHPDELQNDLPDFIQFRVNENSINTQIGAGVQLSSL